MIVEAIAGYYGRDIIYLLSQYNEKLRVNAGKNELDILPIVHISIHTWLWQNISTWTGFQLRSHP